MSSLLNDAVNLEEASSPLRRPAGEQRRVASKPSAQFTTAVRAPAISDSPGYGYILFKLLKTITRPGSHDLQRSAIYKQATGAVQLVPQQITSVRIVCAYISDKWID